MARRPKSTQPKRAEGGDAETKSKPPSKRTRSRAQTSPGVAPGVATNGPPPSPEQRLELLERALAEIGKVCNLLVGATLPPADGPAIPPAPGPNEPATWRVAPGTEGCLGVTVPLGAFLENLDEQADELNADERRQIVETAIGLLEDVYVHLPLKRAMHAIDPIQRLRILRNRDDTSCRAFHDEMLAIFHSLRDLHTGYILPSYYQQRTAFLPFLVEEYFEGGEGGERRYVVTKVCSSLDHGDFRPGVGLAHWNGIPIGRAVELNARREAGSNPDAQLARGLEALTIRPMGLTAPPDERWVIVGYRTEDGRALEQKFEWRVFTPPPAPSGLELTALGAQAGDLALCLGVDARTEAIRRSKKALFEPRAMDAERNPAAPDESRPDDASAPAGPGPEGTALAPRGPGGTEVGPDPRAVLGLDVQTESVRRSKTTLFDREALRAEPRMAEVPEIPEDAAWSGDPNCLSTMPDVFLFRRVPGPRGELGYLRIFTFMVADADAFVAEFLRIASLLPQDGLILDVRGNGGGNILAGERLLQVLTPRTIEPQRFHFLNTPATLDLCNATPFGLDLTRWSPSIGLAIETGDTYSQGFPMEPAERSNRIGQRYHGPVVLIVDALCYSTTDLVAAGFQDHEIGEILGTARHTGAGGANVWEYALFHQALPDRFGPLPKGTAFRVALRRNTRVGPRAGVPVEDLGVEPDRIHRMTRRDVLGRNEDLIAAAAEILASKPVRALAARLESPRPPEVVVGIDARNIERVDVYLGDRPLGSAAVRDGRASLALVDGLPGPGTLELRGVAEGRVVAVTRLAIP